MVKTCLNQKIIKNSNLIQAMKNSVCPTANVTRMFQKAEFSEVSELWIQHTTWWSWSDSYWIFRKPHLFEYLPNVPKCGLNTRHDKREVTLIHLTRAQTLCSDKCATGSIHAKGSMTINVIPCYLFYRSGLCLVPSAIHLRSQAAGDDHCCRYYNPLSAKKYILKKILCI